MLTYFQLKTKHQSLFLLFTIKKDPILYPLLRFVSIISLFCLKYFYEAHAQASFIQSAAMWRRQLVPPDD